MKKINPVFFWTDWFFASLSEKEKAKIKKARLKKLSRGQIYLWDALNIYDDILDGLGGASGAEKLPLANNYFRRYLEIYYRLNLPASFYSLFNFLLADLEKSNREESKLKKLEIKDGVVDYKAKLPEFSDLKLLARKSLALSSSSLAVLYLAGNRKVLKKVPPLLDFFRYALAAKQLSDDAKDWPEDLENGALTYPISLILKTARKKKTKIDLKNKPEIAYLLFAQIAPRIGRDIKYLCFQARREAKKAGLKENSPLLSNIIGPLEKAVEEARKFQRLFRKAA